MRVFSAYYVSALLPCVHQPVHHVRRVPGVGPIIEMCPSTWYEHDGHVLSHNGLDVAHTQQSVDSPKSKIRKLVLKKIMDPLITH